MSSFSVSTAHVSDVYCFCFTDIVHLCATETIQRERERNEVKKCIDCRIRFSWIASQAHHEWGIELFDPIAPDPHISFIICPWWKQFRVHCSSIAESLSAYWLSLLCCLPTAIFSAVFSFSSLYEKTHSVSFHTVMHRRHVLNVRDRYSWTCY